MSSVFFLPGQERPLASRLEALARAGIQAESWNGEEGTLLLLLSSQEELEEIQGRLEGETSGVSLVWILPGGDSYLWEQAGRIGGDAFVPFESGDQGLLGGIEAVQVAAAERELWLLPWEEALAPPPGMGQGKGRLGAGWRKIFVFSGNVALEGEEGSGRTILARALHSLRRPEGPYVVLDAGALEERELLDLFLGRTSGERGLLSRLRGGTLVLRDPQKMGHSAQAALYAWLHRERERNGGAEGGMVKVVSLVPRSLASLALEGEFNRALALILEERSLSLPSLRERKGEIPAMASAWCAAPGRGCCLSLSAARALQGHQWPRNASELVEVLEAAFSRAGRGSTILPMHLPPQFRAAEEGPDREELYLLPRLAPSGQFPRLKEFREKARLQAERVYLLRALETAGGKVTEARKIAGFSKSTFYALLQKHGLLPPRKRGKAGKGGGGSYSEAPG